MTQYRGNEEPPIDGSVAAAEYLTRRFSHNVEPLKIATQEVDDILVKMLASRLAIGQLEGQLATYENQVKLFIKRPIVVEAVQWFKGQSPIISRTDEDHHEIIYPDGRGGGWIETPSGNFHVSPGYKPDIFAMTYEKVEDE